MSDFTSGNAPGFAAQVEGDDVNVLWVGRHGQDLVATRKMTIVSTTVDAATRRRPRSAAATCWRSSMPPARPTPTRPMPTTAGRSPSASWNMHQDMLVDGVATDRFTQMLVHGLVQEGELLNLDPRAKQQLGQRFVVRPRNLAAGRRADAPARHLSQERELHGRRRPTTACSSWPTAAVTFTLPTKQNGLAFRFAADGRRQPGDRRLGRHHPQEQCRGQHRHVQHGQRKDRQPRARRVPLYRTPAR